MRQEIVVRGPADLGRALAEVRRRRGLTQGEVAELAGIERTYLSRLENGAATVQLERALRALRRLGASVTVTFEREDA
jgi:HTH-type transcriptional regulator / antitoxin HipB